MELSPWKGEPNELRIFLDIIDASGGDDYEEAIEIGLCHVNKERKKYKIHKVILIGDSPPKLIEAIIRDRKKYGGEKEWISLFGPPTGWKSQAKELKQYNITIDAMYLKDDKDLVNSFNEISLITGGKSQKLDLKGPKLLDYTCQIIIKTTTNNEE